VWPVCLMVSALVHATLIFSVGVKSGTPAATSASVFSLVDFSADAVAVVPSENIAARTDPAPTAVSAQPAAKRQDEPPGAALVANKTLTIDKDSPRFYTSSEVSEVAQLQLPLEGVMFADELALSGRLVLDIAVSDLGKVVNIDVVEAIDASGALRARMLPLLRDAPFAPAYKDGKPVNSVRRVEFTLGIVIDDPTKGFNSAVSPGFRPRMDERGNILKEQPKP
jgi:hypothetical protein